MNINVILYSTNCPKCIVLEKKLNEKKIDFTKVADIEEMKKENIYSAPYLKVDGLLMSFYEAIQYINSINQ